jgi:hypothetical protein
LVEVFEVVLGFVTAVAAGILIKLWIEHYFRPILVIEGDEAIVVRAIELHTNIVQDNVPIDYYANRIMVRNRGRSAAKDCKVYVDYPQGNREHEINTERTAWLVPYANSGYTLTLNVNDREFVDLCAISDDVNQPRVIPLEYGYTQGRIDSCTPLPPVDMDITVRVTSSNAKPTERSVRLHTAVDHFVNQHGKIVEFIE